MRFFPLTFILILSSTSFSFSQKQIDTANVVVKTNEICNNINSLKKDCKKIVFVEYWESVTEEPTLILNELAKFNLHDSSLAYIEREITFYYYKKKLILITDQFEQPVEGNEKWLKEYYFDKEKVIFSYTRIESFNFWSDRISGYRRENDFYYYKSKLIRQLQKEVNGAVDQLESISYKTPFTNQNLLDKENFQAIEKLKHLIK